MRAWMLAMRWGQLGALLGLPALLLLLLLR
jgi:hypothetical protein